MEILDRRTALAYAIYNLDHLVMANTKDESLFQDYFNNNPIVFDILGFKNHYDFTRDGDYELPRDKYTGLKPEPDFIVQNPSNLFEIFEIDDDGIPHDIKAALNFGEWEIIFFEVGIGEDYFTMTISTAGETNAEQKINSPLKLKSISLFNGSSL